MKDNSIINGGALEWHTDPEEIVKAGKDVIVALRYNDNVDMPSLVGKVITMTTFALNDKKAKDLWTPSGNDVDFAAFAYMDISILEAL